MRKLKYSKEQIEEAVKKSISIAGVCRELGLVDRGGNYMTIKRYLVNYEINVDHFLGQAHQSITFKPFEVLKKPEAQKRSLIKERGHQCENCKLEIWQDKPIPLELEHVDGNRANSNQTNLKLLCPNCHALTPTWKRKKANLPNLTDEEKAFLVDLKEKK